MVGKGGFPNGVCKLLLGEHQLQINFIELAEPENTGILGRFPKLLRLFVIVNLVENKFNFKVVL